MHPMMNEYMARARQDELRREAQSSQYDYLLPPKRKLTKTLTRALTVLLVGMLRRRPRMETSPRRVLQAGD